MTDPTPRDPKLGRVEPNALAGAPQSSGLGSSRSTPEEATGLPGLRSWRAVYVFVGVCFVAYVVALTIFTRWFA
jgi:hypothetical protein